MQLLKILFPPCVSLMWLCRFFGIPGNRLPLSGWSSESSMLLFVTAGACFLISILFHLRSGSRLLPTPLTSLLDSVSAGSSSQWARESLCSAGRHCQRCSSHQSSQHVTQPAVCCGFVLNYSNSLLSQGNGQQTSSAPSHLGCFHQPFSLDPWAGGPVCFQSLLCALG